MAKGSGGLPDSAVDTLKNLPGADSDDLSSLKDALRGTDDRSLSELRDLLNNIDVGQSNKGGAPSHGQDTDDTTGSALNGGTSLTVPDNFGVRVKALSTNSAPIYVGSSGVSGSSGFELSAGSGIVLYVTDVNMINFIASSSGDGVSWIIEQAA